MNEAQRDALRNNVEYLRTQAATAYLVRTNNNSCATAVWTSIRQDSRYK